MRLLPALPSLLVVAACAEPAPTPDSGAETAAVGWDLRDAGFATPESVLHHADADVYLVSNINGDPGGKDDNGFISRVSPDGTVEELKWIDGAAEDVELHAPKGMAVQEGTLYVTDIDCVRMFDAASGAPSGEVCVPDATFLNDIAPDAQGTLFVTDTGLESGPDGLVPTGTDAVYRLSGDGRMAAIARGEWLGRPNGVAVGSRGIFVVTFGSGEVHQLAVDGSHEPVMPASDRQLDGVEFTDDGGFVFSSWGESAVFRVAGDGVVTRIVEDVEAPADIGLDRTRGRVLIPQFSANAVLARPLDHTP